MAYPAVTSDIFWSRVDKSTECWNWTGRVDKTTGYGKVSFMRRRNCSPHRIAYELSFGGIPKGMWVLHKCDNRMCCNPDHLFLGTYRDNIDDMVSKGRSLKGEKNVKAVLTENTVRKIKRMLTRGYRQIDISRDMGIKSVTIQAIASGRNWGWL